MDSKDIGKKIALLRAQSGMRLRELSRKAKVSAGALSSIERGQNSPTLATLHKILRGMGQSFSSFFGDSGTAGPVFPRREMRAATDQHREYVFTFPERGGMKFEIVRETILPTEEKSEWETHDCDLGGLVLSGGPAHLEIEGHGQWPLKRGDAFYVKAGLTHRATNRGRGPLKLITVMAPPRY
jgi:transcriptional regulator with XRE-family HTH domain